MKHLLLLAKALSDPNRLRILAAIEGGELCVSQLVALLEVAPATVSAHCSILERAELVERRKAGRWVYYHLPRSVAPSTARRLLLDTLRALEDDDGIVNDRERLGAIREPSPQTLTARLLNPNHEPAS